MAATIITVDMFGDCQIIHNHENQKNDSDNIRMTLFVKEKIYVGYINRYEHYIYIGQKFTSSGYLCEWFRLNESLTKNKQKEKLIYDCVITYDGFILQFNIYGKVYTIAFDEVNDLSMIDD